jgi:hypothetical protein
MGYYGATEGETSKTDAEAKKQLRRNRTALRSSDELSSRDQVSRKELILSSVPEVLSMNSNGKGVGLR